MGEGNRYTLRVNITRGNYGLWRDTIIVSYTKQSSKESKILENDSVNMYGTLSGMHTYQTVLGSELTIPLFHATYIDVITQ